MLEIPECRISILYLTHPVIRLYTKRLFLLSYVAINLICTFVCYARTFAERFFSDRLFLKLEVIDCLRVTSYDFSGPSPDIKNSNRSQDDSSPPDSPNELDASLSRSSAGGVMPDTRSTARVTPTLVLALRSL